MAKPGQIAILRFPTVDFRLAKPRPVLLVVPAPGPYDDWLVCMISSQRRQAVPDFDEIIDRTQDDFDSSGLKVTSVIRVARLAVTSVDMLEGTIGEISPERFKRIQQRLAEWVQS